MNLPDLLRLVRRGARHRTVERCYEPCYSPDRSEKDRRGADGLDKPAGDGRHRALVMRNLARTLKRDGVFIISMFDTLITRRLWKALDRSYVRLQGIVVRDEASAIVGRVRVLRPPV